MNVYLKACSTVIAIFVLGIFLQAEDPLTVRISPDLVLEKIDSDVWIHISTVNMPPWGRVSANGLAVRSGNEILLIDTPWNNEQTQRLSEWLYENTGARVTKVIVCHFHDDNLGGLGWVHSSGIASYSLERTRNICREKGLPVPMNAVSGNEVPDWFSESVHIFFPGEGHTVDSICVYLPLRKILFGGCSVKALDNKTLGNTADANLAAWPASLRKMKKTFPDARLVVPGHGRAGGLDLVDHTLSLFN